MRAKDDWQKLCILIHRYVEAEIEDSWKGGGDPMDIPYIEIDLSRTRKNLERHISSMREKYHAG